MSTDEEFNTEVPKNFSEVLEQELEDNFENLNSQFQRYQKNKFLLQCIEDCIAPDSPLKDHLKTKIRKIIFGEKVSQLSLEGFPGETLLGIPLNESQLTYSENEKLCNCLINLLERKHKILPESTINSPLELNHHNQQLLDLQRQLTTQQELYMKNLSELLKLLEKLKETRLEAVPKAAERKYSNSKLKTRLNSLKAEIAKRKCRTNIFTESSDSLEAYKELIEDMKELEGDLKQEVKDLKKLKQKYTEVSCAEYDAMLKTYSQYKAVLERKKQMLQLCE
ncbi:probable DNA double-strand break repair Rad50 ATPase [Euwallacea similis]|uniref:probable DNA double-strand break repair Rad50 ATPase n=1 Tax=Euwallacea similis TaxID=1736056 RepID=UPI00344ECC2D